MSGERCHICLQIGSHRDYKCNLDRPVLVANDVSGKRKRHMFDLYCINEESKSCSDSETILFLRLRLRKSLENKKQ